MRAAGVTLLLVTSFIAAPLTAQTASPYVPLHHWAMPYVEYLITAGVMADPTPLTRPLKQADVIHALEAADTIRLGDAVWPVSGVALNEVTNSKVTPAARIGRECWS